MKSYTNIEQSKKLAEILPLESADMYWQSNLDNSDRTYLLDLGIEEHFEIDINTDHYDIGEFNIPAWSLAALLGVLPNENMLVKTTDGEYYCLAKDVMTKHYDNPVDACVDIVEKLHKRKIL